MRPPTSVLAPQVSGLSECLDRLAANKQQIRPVATYRVQFHSEFRFADVQPLISYLHALGITHLYSSPILKARAGSRHGYDITDHNTINPELGTEEEFRNLVAELKSHQMGLVLDVVPNHMGVGYGDNPWWQDVLENGQASQYASFFDIDWRPVKPELGNRVLLPILGDTYGAELESGNIKLDYRDGRFTANYYDKLLPIDPQTYPLIWEPLGDLRAVHPELALNEADRSELENVLFELRQLPAHTATDPDLARRRREQAPPLKARLASLAQRSSQAAKLIREVLRLANGTAGNPRSFDCLHRLLEAQAYRLAYWRVSADEINYRRFFDINDLVGLRMEDPHVFAATHRLIRKLLAEGCISGLRLDHPDGLFNPPQYFTRAQMLYAASQCCGADPLPPLAENGIEMEVQEIFGQHDWIHRHAPLYVLVEKILEPGEDLPKQWAVDGTVGYDFANLVNGVFIDTRNERAFTALYRRFSGRAMDVDTLIYESKKLIMRTALSSEVTVLSHMLDEISSTDRHARDFTRNALTDVIREAIACFPVYRTYIDERGNLVERDRAYINEAIGRAKRRNESTNAAMFDFLRDILLLKVRDGNTSSEEYRKRLYFTLKFQQLTGPVMAKGLEDTSCYVYNRLVSVNEVGGSPREFGVSVGEFHRGNQKRMEDWPYSMLATSTHDAKRSEDVRARINVLTEMPRHWSSVAMRWRRNNKAKKRQISDGRVAPDNNEEFLLYQTLVGAWPFEMSTEAQRRQFVKRIQEYMLKAVNEAKVNMSWVNPNPEYTDALHQFIARILAPGSAAKPNLFLQQLQELVTTVSYFGAFNSLAQVLLKITAPGVPDIYQGQELWDFSLVDPDNRRAVDFQLRRQLLTEMEGRAAPRDNTSFCNELVESYRDGRIKLWTTLRALCLRREHRELFQTGAYLPLAAEKGKHEHVIAFARERGWERAVVAVPRFSYALMQGKTSPPLGDAWGEAELALPGHYGGEFENVFTGEILQTASSRRLLCREVFAHFPVALLMSL
jgi:(1->4)-alpha-D-glucan 1-alpha-D-glucosylmutase